MRLAVIPHITPAVMPDLPPALRHWCEQRLAQGRPFGLVAGLLPAAGLMDAQLAIARGLAGRGFTDLGMSCNRVGSQYLVAYYFPPEQVEAAAFFLAGFPQWQEARQGPIVVGESVPQLQADRAATILRGAGL